MLPVMDAPSNLIAQAKLTASINAKQYLLLYVFFLLIVPLIVYLFIFLATYGRIRCY